MTTDVETAPLRRHEEIAARIVKCEGLTLVIAGRVGKEGDVREACNYLKAAIAKALASELERGAQNAMAGLL